jgi:hypothetical protein
MKTFNTQLNQTWLCVALAAVLIISLSGATARAGNGASAKILPPNSHPYGMSYGEWSEAWWQWCFSLPVTSHPLFDTADVSTGQSGQVWFIAGNFTGTPVTRNVTIPSGKALFFPIFNAWGDNTDCNGAEMISDGNTEAFLRNLVKTTFIDPAQNLSCTIDGRTVTGLADPANSPYLVASPTPGGFSYVIPSTDSLLDYFGLTCWANNSGTPILVSAAIYHPVAEGFYLMVAPLSVGSHTIHCHGGTSAFTEDFTYNITVVPGPAAVDQ